MSIIPFHETVVVQCLGVDYQHWESVQIEVSMQVGYAQATLTTTEVSPPGESDMLSEWNFPPGSLVEIYATGDVIFSGVVFQYIPSADANQHSITLVCRTIPNNFVVSSVESETGQYQNTYDTSMVSLWAQSHGANVLDLSAPRWIPWFQTMAGATKWQESLRVLGPSGKMLFGDALGNLIITGGKALRSSGTLVQGVNIEAMSALLQDTQYMVHEVIGQSPSGVDLAQTLMPRGISFATIAGSGYRYKKIIDQTATTVLQAQAVANWNRNRSAGNAMQATIVAPGWRDLDNIIWLINQDVYVQAPWLHLNCTLRTFRVVFMQNLQQGTVTQLTLMDPRMVAGADSASIYEGSPPICESGSIWDIGWDWAAETVTTLASAATTAASYIPKVF